MPLRDGFVSPERLFSPLAPGPKSEVKWCQSLVTGAPGVSCGPTLTGIHLQVVFTYQQKTQQLSENIAKECSHF